jgi:hypothetical protein
VQSKHQAGHVLVKSGLYGYLRHPSYFGFFWWGLGTQLVLGNAVCFVGYALVLWRFFSSRIRGMSTTCENGALLLISRDRRRNLSGQFLRQRVRGVQKNHTGGNPGHLVCTRPRRCINYSVAKKILVLTCYGAGLNPLNPKYEYRHDNARRHGRFGWFIRIAVVIAYFQARYHQPHQSCKVH